jgi:hypothetical protein
MGEIHCTHGELSNAYTVFLDSDVFKPNGSQHLQNSICCCWMGGSHSGDFEHH